MSRYVGQRAPTEHTPTQSDALKADPEIVPLRRLLGRLIYEARQKSNTVKDAQAEETNMNQM